MENANGLARTLTLPVAACALVEDAELHSEHPHLAITVAASRLPQLHVGDIVVGLGGRHVPRRLAAVELVEGVRRRAEGTATVDLRVLRVTPPPGGAVLRENQSFEAAAFRGISMPFSTTFLRHASRRSRENLYLVQE